MKKNYSLLMLFFLVEVSSAQWAQLPQKPDSAKNRFGAFVFSNGNKIYCGGGAKEGSMSYGFPLKDFYEYDTDLQKWSKKRDIPIDNWFATSFSVDGKGYIGPGGNYNSSLTDSQFSELWQYQSSNDTWLRKADFPAKAMGRSPASFTIGHMAYVVADSNFFEYDPALNTWTKKSNFPGSPSTRPSAFAINSFGYVISWGVGGSNPEFWRYDPSKNLWEKKTSFKGAQRISGVGFSLDQKQVGCAGLGMQGTKLFADLYSYDPIKDSWSKLADFSGGARGGAVVTTVGDSAFVGDGYDGQGGIGIGNLLNDWWTGTLPQPSSVSIGGCPVFPSDNPWNQDISNYPIHKNSDVFIAAINKTRQFLHADFGTPAEYGIPYIIVDSTQPPVQITYNAYPDESDPGPFPVPANAPVEGGANSGGDMHVLVIDKSNCMLYEFWKASKDQSGSGWTMANGAKFDLTQNEYRPDGWTSADAAGLPIFPGLVRYEEVAAGAINHALRFTVDNSQRGWIHPARHQAGKNDTTYPPMGLRLRLKADYDISKVTGQSKIILQALKKYGMINADNGSSWFISGTSNPLWDDNDLNQLKKIPGSAFEAVYTGPIKTSPSSITITVPKAGEVIAGGNTNYQVKCTTSGVDTLRTLEFSSDGGITWSQVSGLRGTSTFTWSQIPNVATTKAMIRISDEMANTATSGVFTITSKSSASITYVSLSGIINGHITTGKPTTISWSSSGYLGSTVIAEYSIDNTNWTLIDNMIDPSLHSYQWTVPAPTGSMYVRIRSSNDASIYGTYGPFAVDPVKGIVSTKTYDFKLSNYPNPVSGKTEIDFTLPQTEYISLKIFSPEGIQVANLFTGEMEEGEHVLIFDTHSLPDGMYFYRLNTGTESVMKKMIVLK